MTSVPAAFKQNLPFQNVFPARTPTPKASPPALCLAYHHPYIRSLKPSLPLLLPFKQEIRSFFSFLTVHFRYQRTASLVRDAAIAAGAPDNCIQWLEIADDNLLEKCNHCPDISGLILSGLSTNIRKVFSAFSAECILSFPQPAFCYIHYSLIRHLLQADCFIQNL